MSVSPYKPEASLTTLQEATREAEVEQVSWKIQIKQLSKSFTIRGKQITALDDVSLEIQNGQFYSLVGPSGCGKTTLLRIIGDLETLTNGQLVIARSSQEAQLSKPLTSMVFQEQSVFPWMTVRDNIAFGLKARGMARQRRYQIAHEYIEKVGLRGFEHARPHQLSGGMKQRVSIARAFANDPEILLMDEPFGALDEQNKILLHEELLKIWEESQKTVIFVTHSIDEAIMLSDHIVVMSARPGRIKAVLPVTIPRPRSTETVHAHPAFTTLYNQIWGMLRDEVIIARQL